MPEIEAVPEVVQGPDVLLIVGLLLMLAAFVLLSFSGDIKRAKGLAWGSAALGALLVALGRRPKKEEEAKEPDDRGVQDEPIREMDATIESATRGESRESAELRAWARDDDRDP
jgi:hypothetical protein